ncbi:MAG: AAA family ATPase [Taibaiella sp.]|jgi:predicted ATP-dependent endonuclease of OLD family
MKIEKVTIKNFRGIEELIDFELKKLSIIIGNNGTSKTAILEAINFALSPSFLSGRIKHTDFHKGLDAPIIIQLKFDGNFKAHLPDGYQTQEVECNGIYLRIKKRDRAANGKAFTDIVVIEHYVVPTQQRTNQNGWEIPRKGTGKFKFTERLLTFPVTTEGLPRAYFYGKNRDKQLQKGFNSSIASVYDDFNWRFLKELRKEPHPPQYYQDKRNLETSIISKVDEKAFEKTFDALNAKLTQLGLKNVSLAFFETNAPFESAFLNQVVENIEIPVNQLGSGIEMIVSLLFLETLASLSRDQFIVIIDEPELHLHPLLQISFISYLISLSTNVQIVLNTHSPYFYKNCLANPNIELLISQKDTNEKVSLSNTGSSFGLFPWSPSWGEINYRAFSMSTVEFHNELYGRVQERENAWRETEIETYFSSKSLQKSKQWTRVSSSSQVGQPYPITLMSYIRNSIHHPENTQNQKYTELELDQSIIQLIHLLENP